MKKLTSLILAVCMLSALFVPSSVIPASAETVSLGPDEISAQVNSLYQRCRTTRNGASFSGYCGAYVGWQLFHMGINTMLIAPDGKDAYNTYADSGITSGGYTVKKYPATQYSMTQALNAISNNGTKNVYNVMVCWEKGNTSSSQVYGHVSFIHAIINGYVYFSESSNIRRGDGSLMHSEGSMIVYHINEVAQKLWMVNAGQGIPQFEGLVHFIEPSPIDAITLRGFSYPINKETGRAYAASGTILSPNPLKYVELYVRNKNTGELMFVAARDGYKQNTNYGRIFNLFQFDGAMSFSSLPVGTYLYCVKAIDTQGNEVYSEHSFTVSGSATTQGVVPFLKGKTTHTHNWGEGEIVRVPTLDKTGIKLYTCSCGEKKQESIPQLTVSSISISSYPRIMCSVGDNIRTDGLALSVTYSDGSTEKVTDGYTVEGLTSATAGRHWVTVSYGGKSTSYLLTVRPKAPAAPQLKAVTENSITLMEIPDCEYKLSDGEWQDSPLFEGLTPKTEYTFVQRIKSKGDIPSSYESEASTFATSEEKHIYNGPALTAGSAFALPGQTVQIPVLLQKNPGISGLVLTFQYDKDALSLEGGKPVDGEVAEEFGSVTHAGNSVFVSVDHEDVTENGVLVYLPVKIAKDAAFGDYTIDVVVRECVNAERETVELQTVSGKLTVVDPASLLYGDVDASDEVDLSDVILLCQYLADFDWDTGVSSVAVGLGADANGDTSVDLSDVILLCQYLAEYDYDAGTSPIVLGPKK